MTAPGTILISKMLVPEVEVPATLGHVTMPEDVVHSEENLIGAIARGTIDGGRLAFNVGIMLISFLALIGLLNGMLGGVSYWLGGHHIPISFQPECHSWVCVCSDCVAHWDSVAQRAPGGQFAGYPHGDQ